MTVLRRRVEPPYVDGGHSVEFHRRPVKLGHLHNQALDVFERDVFVEVAQSNFLGDRRDIDYSIGVAARTRELASSRS
jgi:hypothetical protein